jgi:SPX domain protein involved in polyphosphate accumulation
MKFTYYMKRHMVPAWIKLYLNYKLLKTSLQVSTKVKDLLVMAKKTKSGREYRVIKRKVMDSRQLMDKLTHDNKQFVQNFNEEFIKLENFISWKYTDLKQKMSKIQQQIKIMRIIREEIEILYLTLRKSRSWHQVFTEKEPESYKDG